MQLTSGTMGTGLHGGYHINDMFFVGADFTAISLSQEDNDGQDEVEIDLDFSTQVLMCRVSPFSGSFFAQAGLVSRSWKIEADGVGEIGDSGQVGRIKATVEFPSIGFNLGIGWNWIADFGLSGGLGIGLITGGKPEVDLESKDLLTALVAAEEIDKEEKNLQEEMDKYATMPYIHLNIGWNF